ncbi:hypothetical protein K461DRAFT_141578 [Myriangium duriaei CBS 260.36]|uniref:Protein kinase domain-containing protein n=1 Tax=Myriangium duriaei CBS 260.36 TaxID=1168546 RepID=A0A9P4MNA7_9PEZI|nr:hypothetical protein K461DRAFT_141578 [Myriangium duriaei CBS 260.36]
MSPLLPAMQIPLTTLSDLPDAEGQIILAYLAWTNQYSSLRLLYPMMSTPDWTFLWPNRQRFHAGDLASIVEVQECPGGPSWVFLHEPHHDFFLKVPLRRTQESSTGHIYRTLAAHHREVEAFTCLNGVEGIANCKEFSQGCLLMPHYCRETVSHRMKAGLACKPPKALRWTWMAQAVKIIGECHRLRVLIADFSVRSLSITDDHSLHVTKLENAIILDEEVDMIKEEGQRARDDLYDLGTVLYDLSTWLESPSTSGPCGPWTAQSHTYLLNGFRTCWRTIISKCWNRRYSTIQEVMADCREFGIL